jgi:HEAT repeat protein
MRRIILITTVLAVSGLSHAQESRSRTVGVLLTEFQAETVFWRQFSVAQRIAELQDTRAIRALESWLQSEDRHGRGNAAYVLARLGDPRGFETLVEILNDVSDRGDGQGVPGVVSTCSVGSMCRSHNSAAQIQADRYYAVHLLGELGDPRAVDVLVPLLVDDSRNYNVAWALGKMGDSRATPPLVSALRDPDALVRVVAIQALAHLQASEALPHLRELLNDFAVPSAGDQVPVADVAREAIAVLEERP